MTFAACAILYHLREIEVRAIERDLALERVYIEPSDDCTPDQLVMIRQQAKSIAENHNTHVSMSLDYGNGCVTKIQTEDARYEQ